MEVGDPGQVRSHVVGHSTYHVNVIKLKQERYYSDIDSRLLGLIRSRNEEAINSTRNWIYPAKGFILPTYRRRYFLFLSMTDLVGVLATTGKTSAVAGYTRV